METSKLALNDRVDRSAQAKINHDVTLEVTYVRQFIPTSLTLGAHAQRGLQQSPYDHEDVSRYQCIVQVSLKHTHKRLHLQSHIDVQHPQEIG